MWLLVFVILTSDGNATFHNRLYQTEAECDEQGKNLPDPPNMAVIGTCIDLNKVVGRKT